MTTMGPDGIPSTDRPAKPFHLTAGRRFGDRAMGVLIRLGLVPHCYLLTTRGRKTGKPRTTPVTIVDQDGRRWLVAPYGPVSWVLNVRADQKVTLSRGGRSVVYTAREAGATEAGPVLKQYLAMTRPTRPYFEADVGSPVAAFVAEAARHPVFELTV